MARRIGGPGKAYLERAHLAAMYLVAERARGAGVAIARASSQGAPWAESHAARDPRDSPSPPPTPSASFRLGAPLGQP
jgi:hypothetical protein